VKRALPALALLLVPATAAAVDEAPGPPEPSGLRTAIRTDAGYAIRRLHMLDVEGGDVGAAIGAHQGSFAVWAAPRLFLGSSENGLSVWSFRIGGEFEGWVGERLALGAGFGLFWVGVGRAARHETILGGGVSGSLSARLDVAREGRATFFLRTTLEGGVEVNQAAAFWGPFLGVGVDFDVVSRTR
jgi:hypothetical protein